MIENLTIKVNSNNKSNSNASMNVFGEFCDTSRMLILIKICNIKTFYI